MSARCPVHGPWSTTSLVCPACGEALEAYDVDVEISVAIEDLRANERAMLVDRARADADEAARRLKLLAENRGR